MWGAEVTVSWTATSGALGSTISSVDGTANGTIATTSGTEISYNWNYTRTLVTLKSGKSDYISMSGSYMQCGSSNAGESVEFRTSNIPGTIKSVTVLLGSKDSRHTGSITVGGTNYNAGDIPAWANSAGGEWEGTGTSSGEIVISIDCNEKKSPIYIASITVVYEEGGSSTPTCATPTFSPAAGAVLSGTEVTISCATAGATIHYTTDGSDPTATSATSQPISVTSATTIKAIAVKEGSNNSAIATASYTILEPKTIAQIMPSTTAEGDEFLLNDVTVTYAYGNYTYVKDASGYMMIFSSILGAANGKVLQGLQGKAKLYSNLPEISTVTKAPTVTDGSTVEPEALTAYPVAADLNKYVTLEGVTFASAASLSGTVANVNGTFMDNPLIIRNTFKLDGISLATGKNYRIVGIVQKYNSDFQVYPISVEEIIVPGKVATPTFSPAAGEFDAAQNVTISCATDGATIYYTTNGDTPDNTKAEYTSAITVDETMTIKAIAIKDGMTNSDIASATYTITTGSGTGSPVTFNYVDYKGQGTNSSGSAYTMVKTDVSIESTTFFGNNSQAHFYGNGEITVTPATGVTIKEIVINTTSTSYNGYQSSGTVTASTGSLSHVETVVTWTGSADAAFTISHNKQIRWTTIVVTYETADPSTPILTVVPNTIDFGDVEQGESVASKTVAVNFANLAGTVTYSGLSSPFSATGTISTTGDEITIAADATAAVGEYEQTLTVSSTTDSKEATVTVTMNVVPAETGEQFIKVTAAPAEDNWSGDYLLVYESGTTAYVWDGTDDAEKCKTATIKSGNKIIKPEGAAVIYIEKITDGHSLQIIGGSNDGKYIVDNGNNAALKFGNEAYAATISYETDWTKILFSQRCIRYNSTSGQDRFRYYADNGQQAVQLYKAVNSKSPAGIAYAVSAVEKLVGADKFTNELTNPHTLTVTYSSNNTDVATVDATTGEVTIVAAGEAKITATYAGGETYRAASVSYTITVSSVTPSTDNVVIIAEYDSKFYALTNSISNKTAAAIVVEKDGDKIVVPNAEAKTAIQWTKITNGANTTFQDANSKYLKGVDNGGDLTLADDACNWSWNTTGGYYCIGSRSFIYRESANGFKNYAATNAGSSDYSTIAEVRVIDPANIVITSKVSAELAYNPASDEITQGDSWSAPTLVNPHSVTITSYASDNESVATVEGGVIALAGGTGTANITAHFAGDASYLEGDAVYTIIVNAPAPVPTGTSYAKVTSTDDITANGEYLLVYETASKAFNGDLATLDGENNTVDVVISEGKIAGTSAIDAAIFTIDATTGDLRSHSGHYVGVGSYGNGMTQSDEAGTYANVFAINTSENVDITITFAGGDMHLLYNTGGRFRYYKAENQTNKAIQLYKKETPEYETVRSSLEINRYYTVCLPKKVIAIKGASFWTLNTKSTDGSQAYLEEETNHLPFAAGKPFIIQATANKLEVVYEGDETTTAGVNGAIHGTLTYMNAAALAAAGSDVYMLYQNELRPVGENNHLDANRAYVILSELTPVSEAEAPHSAPGKRVKSMPMQPQVATGMDELNASEQPVKLMINGQLFILRGEKLYDATGRLVK